MRKFKCITIPYGWQDWFIPGKVYDFYPSDKWSLGGYLEEGSSSTSPEPEYFREVTFNIYYEQLPKL